MSLQHSTATARTLGLAQVLSWGVASGKGIEVQEPPFRSELKAPRIEALREELLQVASGSVEQGASGLEGAKKQAAELLLSSVSASSSAPSAVQRCCLRLSEELLQLAGEGRSENAAASAVLEDSIDRMFCATVSGMLYFRFLVILELNWSVKEDLLPFIDLAAPSSSPYGKLLSYLKPRLLGHLKYAQFQQILQRTKYEGSAPGIILNRKAAMTARERGKVDWEFRRSLTGQFMSELRKHSGSPKLFRRPWLSRFVKVQFKGEGGEDAGGLYREALDAVTNELHSKLLPLFVPCPNAVAEVGENRDGWVLNPRANSLECVRALEFVGQLIGLALRTGDLLPFSLAPFTWKGIVGDERKREDVRAIDIFAEKHLAMLSKPEVLGEEMLSSIVGQFAYPDVTGEEIELMEGGRDISVTAETAPKFARLLLNNRLTFDHLQMQALRRGLATVVPLDLLRLWSWQDLQERICGVKEVDVECLKRHTTYKNCTPSGVHVGYLWQALESFSQKERRSFLRFVWGRGSLPAAEKWERQFTVQLLSDSDDSRLPCSHTCFFTLDLPSFSSAEVCREKLLYCITNCVAIDADGAAARSLNWDEDEED
ncbi:unnamed protein product [Polarella glacialis]|uniref:HECT domain-containing protein n=1 Tax=Polarella glacialis TaxID=89957 RepID=A0A813LK32_POLGL|nr:unnamed protein product [Polarella glacialis]